MLHRYFIQLSYKGTHYHGWQVQPGSVTIQEVLNNKLSIILKEEIYCVGAGRTDTGVHASQYFAHFDCTNEKLCEAKERFLYHLNCILPLDIAVQDIFHVTPEVHARFSAVSRTYLYRINSKKDPFAIDFSYFYSKKLDINAMNEASKILMEYTDFTSFSKLHTDVKTNNCCIKEAYWTTEGNEIHFYITADRFLRNMVRAIVGTLLKVGEQKITLQEFRTIIEKKDRSSAGISVAACGLYLMKIEYPNGIF